MEICKANGAYSQEEQHNIIQKERKRDVLWRCVAFAEALCSLVNLFCGPKNCSLTSSPQEWKKKIYEKKTAKNGKMKLLYIGVSDCAECRVHRAHANSIYHFGVRRHLCQEPYSIMGGWKIVCGKQIQKSVKRLCHCGSFAADLHIRHRTYVYLARSQRRQNPIPKSIYVLQSDERPTYIQLTHMASSWLLCGIVDNGNGRRANKKKLLEICQCM